MPEPWLTLVSCKCHSMPEPWLTLVSCKCHSMPEPWLTLVSCKCHSMPEPWLTLVSCKCHSMPEPWLTLVSCKCHSMPEPWLTLVYYISLVQFDFPWEWSYSTFYIVFEEEFFFSDNNITWVWLSEVIPWVRPQQMSRQMTLWNCLVSLSIILTQNTQEVWGPRILVKKKKKKKGKRSADCTQYKNPSISRCKWGQRVNPAAPQLDLICLLFSSFINLSKTIHFILFYGFYYSPPGGIILFSKKLLHVCTIYCPPGHIMLLL